MQCTAIDPSAATTDYCRRARRIRASFVGSPSLRQRALNQLATQRNAQTRVVTVREVQPSIEARITATVERGFTEHAAEKLQPFGFTFSDRVELLNSAEKLGISRFRANLILALHEHRSRQTTVAKPVVSAPVAPSFLVILSVEILVVGLIAWACMW